MKEGEWIGGKVVALCDLIFINQTPFLCSRKADEVGGSGGLSEEGAGALVKGAHRRGCWTLPDGMLGLRGREIKSGC